MCGIAGVFAYDARGPIVNRVQLQRTCDRMGCRGPDGDGIWMSADGRAALGHTRLAVIDLSARGAQPMASADGRYMISFNGEIYNYQALRAELVARGKQFQSGSDTEVLLQLYAEKAAAMVHDLRGMFAFAIWDTLESSLFLARDHFGIKPLYIADDGKTLRFASEVKALLAGARECIDTTPEPAGHVGFFLWGSVPEPYTLHRGIRALPAGHTLRASLAGVSAATPFVNIAETLAQAEQSAEATSEDVRRDALREALLDSVRHHLVADVPVGVFLSAGLDSTTLTALASQLGGQLRTVTLGFSEYEGSEQDEVPLAEVVAKQYGTVHRTIRLTRDDFTRGLPHILDRMDQPTIDGVNSFFVSRAAAEAGLKVALSGLGGDELFGGYPSFTEIPRIVSTVERLPARQVVGRTMRRASAPLLRHFTSPKYASLLEYGGDYGGAYLLRRGLYLPWELPAFLDGDLVRAGWAALQPQMRIEMDVRSIGSSRLKVSTLELGQYMRNQLLRDADWASMSHSVEVRVPLVDLTLWCKVAALLGKSRKVSKRLTLATTPQQPLPTSVLERSKTGFAIPVRSWLATEGRKTRQPRGLRGWAQRVYAAMA